MKPVDQAVKLIDSACEQLDGRQWRELKSTKDLNERYAILARSDCLDAVRKELRILIGAMDNE